MHFRDRQDAGRRLAAQLGHLRDRQPVVVGLPRGGVPVAAEVAYALDAPLDVILVRKLGVPYRPELAMGAVGEGGVRVVDERILAQAGVSAQDLDDVERRETAELGDRAARLRGGLPRQPLAGRTVVVVDDGVATGSTARAACRVARAAGAARVVLAVPVAPPGWQRRMREEADELVCALEPSGFMAVGQWYADFSQTSDEEVLSCLRQAHDRWLGRQVPAAGPPGAR